MRFAYGYPATKELKLGKELFATLPSDIEFVSLLIYV